ncbi:DUF2946 family protein [Pseudomonas morbosilactucae]|uniref:DUF2946 family protein n=1 Tax=Pseudomonas morbosilactucae TaxID=2938197 RepID=UPI003CC55F90
MAVAQTNRSLIATMLIACILLGAFTCALRHASSVGLDLALGKPLFCASVSTPENVVELNSGESSQAHPEIPFNCPLCSTIGLNVAVMFCLSWLLRFCLCALPPPWVEPDKTHPHHAWPRLNPRASPRTA